MKSKTNTQHTQEIIMANKNPYEIRFDTLAMAKEMLDRQYEMAQQQYFAALEMYKNQSKDITEAFEKFTPKMYQPQEVMTKAEELYKFIMKKD